MNIKLLKELSKQAETECGWSEEKFAELVVRETLNKIQSVGDKSSNDIPFEITDLFVSGVKQFWS